MQAYHVTGGKGIESLKRVTLESKALGPYDVRVRVHAVSELPRPGWSRTAFT